MVVTRADNFWAGVMICALAGLTVAGARSGLNWYTSGRHAEAALERIHVGMPLDEAIRELTAGPAFARHEECGSRSEPSSRHDFLYGSDDPWECVWRGSD